MGICFVSFRCGPSSRGGCSPLTAPVISRKLRSASSLPVRSVPIIAGSQPWNRAARCNFRRPNFAARARNGGLQDVVRARGRKNPEARISLLRFSEDGRELGATAWREPARLWDLRTGKSKTIHPASAQDQIIRIGFASGKRGEQHVAAGMNGMVGIWDTSKLDQLLAEPICVAEAMVFPTFNADGTKLLTLSGPFWTTMNTIRVWETDFRKPATKDGRPRFDGKDAPPLAGRPRGSHHRRTSPPMRTIFRRLRSRMCARKTRAVHSPDQYQIIWDRFLREPDAKQP